MAITEFRGAHQEILEGSAATYRCRFGDPDIEGGVLAAAAITAITASIVDQITQGAIRAAGSVLNVNGGTLDVDGAFTLKLTGQVDNKIVNSAPLLELEEHLLTLVVHYQRVGIGADQITHAARLFVRKLTQVHT